jgi:hypothetical protein
MFWLEKGVGIASDEGFSVSPEIQSLLYREGDRCLRVACELLTDGIVFYPRSILAGWKRPYGNEKISECHKQKMTDNIYRALKWWTGENIYIVDHSSFPTFLYDSNRAMISSRGTIHILFRPAVATVYFGDKDCQDLMRDDLVFLRSVFQDPYLLTSFAPKCDVLFLYAKLAADGSVIGSALNFREIIRDSGAKIVVVASENPGGHYVKAGKPQPYGRANLVMTINRAGDGFARFFTALFTKMKNGVSMPVAWVELQPQYPGVARPDYPGAIFACELGHLAFG